MKRNVQSGCVNEIDRIARRAEAGTLTLVILNNASIHHDIDPEKLADWRVNHRLILMYLLAYSPELNLIERVWRGAKYLWRCFETWTKDQVHEVIKLMFNKLNPLNFCLFGYEVDTELGFMTFKRLEARGRYYNGVTWLI